MKSASLHKSLLALTAALVFVLAGFTLGLAHGNPPSGSRITIELRQLGLDRKAHLDHGSTRLSFDAICPLPTPPESFAQLMRTPSVHSLFSIDHPSLSLAQVRTSAGRVFDTVLLL